MYASYKQEQVEKMAAAKGLKIVLLLGSTREGRQGLRVAKFVKRQLENDSHSVELLDPVEIPFPIMSKPLHHYQDRSQAPLWLQESGRKIDEADAIIVVSAEYNHSIPPALSNMVDHFPMSFFSYKPSGIVCYSMGPFGGVRAAMQLRCLLGELGCISVSNIFAIPTVQNALDAEGNPKDDRLVSGAQKLIGQLEWHARAMKNHRETNGLPK